jgi:predicted RNase H-like nuclease (RuvC/YqgF family)
MDAQTSLRIKELEQQIETLNKGIEALKKKKDSVSAAGAVYDSIFMSYDANKMITDILTKELKKREEEYDWL